MSAGSDQFLSVIGEDGQEIRVQIVRKPSDISTQQYEVGTLSFIRSISWCDALSLTVDSMLQSIYIPTADEQALTLEIGRASCRERV